MKTVSYFFFYSYIGLVLVAGFWGAFINPTFDQQLLFHLDVNSLSEYTRINLLSQYRFLRAMEFGYGLFSIIFMKQIFSERKYNRLFLAIMSMGVAARIFSLVFDGSPGVFFYVFFSWELLGVLFIFGYTRRSIYAHVAQ